MNPIPDYLDCADLHRLRCAEIIRDLAFAEHHVAESALNPEHPAEIRENIASAIAALDEATRRINHLRGYLQEHLRDIDTLSEPHP
jgi:hypothetical protein